MNVLSKETEGVGGGELVIGEKAVGRGRNRRGWKKGGMEWVPSVEVVNGE